MDPDRYTVCMTCRAEHDGHVACEAGHEVMWVTVGEISPEQIRRVYDLALRKDMEAA